MKAFSAGLTLVNVATMAGLLLGIVGGGLDEGFAGLALLLGFAAAIYAWIGTAPFSLRKVAARCAAAASCRNRSGPGAG